MVLLTFVLIIFFWPKPYYYVPTGTALSVGKLPPGETQRCLGIKINTQKFSDYDSGVPSVIATDCYGWVTPPNDTRVMFKGFQQQIYY